MLLNLATGNISKYPNRASFIGIMVNRASELVPFIEVISMCRDLC
jgi:hypothetical protein